MKYPTLNMNHLDGRKVYSIGWDMFVEDIPQLKLISQSGHERKSSTCSCMRLFQKLKNIQYLTLWASTLIKHILRLLHVEKVHQLKKNSSTVLCMQLIYSGKTVQCFPKYKFPTVFLKPSESCKIS